MNGTSRDRDDFQSRATNQSHPAAGTNIELETTTTTIEKGKADQNGGARSATERAKAEQDHVRQQAAHAGDQVRRSAAEAGERVRRQTRETAELVREQAIEQAGMVKHRVVEQVDSQKNGFATKICDVSSALQRAADDLEQHHDPRLAAQARSLAQRIEGMGNHLRDSQVQDLLEDAEHFVRRNPTLVLGGLFVAGLSLARFLKARPPRYQSAGFQPPAGGPAGRPTGANPSAQRGPVPPLPHDHELTVGSNPAAAGSAGMAQPGQGSLGQASMGRPATPPTTPPATGSPLGTSAPRSGASPSPKPSTDQSPSCSTPAGNSSRGNQSQPSQSGDRNSGGSAPRPR
ncbi:hypothetical protein [Candidatus Laterigemmans baculatus]|uniref:hypothetical protein n=1 Tax=Candidatus Laterigemmans baculatus TaxID=2770505 RepID=UPI0013DA4725|nr:hypothetical protein [Candidatus Laterigemmans baculatus]